MRIARLILAILVTFLGILIVVYAINQQPAAEASAAPPQELVEPQETTLPQSINVKLKYLQGDKNTPMGKRFQDRLYEKWVITDNITIIGADLGVEIKFYKLERLREDLRLSESSRVAAFLSTGKAQDYDKRFAVVHANAWYFPNADIGYGDTLNKSIVMFPKGYGIRLTKGDVVYLRSTTDNAQSYIQRYGDSNTYARAIIYYVEG